MNRVKVNLLQAIHNLSTYLTGRKECKRLLKTMASDPFWHWVSPNGVTHLVPRNGQPCCTCGKSHKREGNIK